MLAPLASVQRWAGLEGKVRRIEISALTKPEDAFAHSDVSRLTGAEFDRWYCTPYVSSIAYQIQQAIPEAQARPVYHVAETEGRIMNRVGVLMALLVVAALVAAGLAVASMMLATVLERRAEIGLFKALGATDARVAAVFLLEAGAIGVLGGVGRIFRRQSAGVAAGLGGFRIGGGRSLGDSAGLHGGGASGNAGRKRLAAWAGPENIAFAGLAGLKVQVNGAAVALAGCSHHSGRDACATQEQMAG